MIISSGAELIISCMHMFADVRLELTIEIIPGVFTASGKKFIMTSAKPLFMLADLGKRYNVKSPKDLSANIDKYLWELR